MPNCTQSQSLNKENARKRRVADRAAKARALIEQALSWSNDNEAAFVLASILTESRHPRLLAAIWREVNEGGAPVASATAHNQRVFRVVRLANDALAKELVAAKP